jgi:hypothetical protein
LVLKNGCKPKKKRKMAFYVTGNSLWNMDLYEMLLTFKEYFLTGHCPIDKLPLPYECPRGRVRTEKSEKN